MDQHATPNDTWSWNYEEISDVDSVEFLNEASAIWPLFTGWYFNHQPGNMLSSHYQVIAWARAAIDSSIKFNQIVDVPTFLIRKITSCEINCAKHCLRNLIERRDWISGDFQLIELVVKNDLLGIFKANFEHRKIHREPLVHLFSFGCKIGAFEIVQWIHQTIALTYEEARFNFNSAFHYACTNEHKEIITWLIKEFKFTIKEFRADYQYVIRNLCEYGKFEMLKWLSGIFELTAEDFNSEGPSLVGSLISSYSFDMLKWIHRKYGFHRDSINGCGVIRSDEYLEIYKWAVKEFGIH